MNERGIPVLRRMTSTPAKGLLHLPRPSRRRARSAGRRFRPLLAGITFPIHWTSLTGNSGQVDPEYNVTEPSPAVSTALGTIRRGLSGGTMIQGVHDETRDAQKARSWAVHRGTHRPAFRCITGTPPPSPTSSSTVKLPDGGAPPGADISRRRLDSPGWRKK